MLYISRLAAFRDASRLHSVILFLLFSLALADPPPYTSENADDYDANVFGHYPTVSFKTTAFKPAHILLRDWSPSCYDEDDYYYFIAPHGRDWPDPQGPMIVDSHGHLVWHQEFPMRSFGPMVQEYKGQDYLTWWTGDDQEGKHGHGFGSYYMYDNTYKLFQKLGAYNDQPADLHEFHITKNNTVLATSYPRMPYDLSEYGREDGFVWEGAFQEFDFATDRLVFKWRATDHFTTHCSEEEIEDKGTRLDPWDFFHINSIDKDAQGNYLISARHCGLSNIDGRTGEVLWRLGGKDNEFKDLSGKGITFKYQHHARWTDNFTAITLFDNHVIDARPRGPPSRGLKIDLDLEQMTVTDIHEFTHPLNVVGEVMGSFQRLDSGNYLVGYGRAAIATEYSPDGNVVCDLSYGPLRRNKRGMFKHSISHSYRTFKQRWKATPYYDPDIFMDKMHNKLFVSWNGATEVRTWGLAASRWNGNWHNVQEVPKAGFESNITVDFTKWVTYQLSAFDKNHVKIRGWLISTKGVIQVEKFQKSSKFHISEPQDHSNPPDQVSPQDQSNSLDHSTSMDHSSPHDQSSAMNPSSSHDHAIPIDQSSAHDQSSSTDQSSPQVHPIPQYQSKPQQKSRPQGQSKPVHKLKPQHKSKQNPQKKQQQRWKPTSPLVLFAAAAIAMCIILSLFTKTFRTCIQRHRRTLMSTPDRGATSEDESLLTPPSDSVHDLGDWKEATVAKG